MFPDGDPANRGKNSIEMLHAAKYQRIESLGFKVPERRRHRDHGTTPRSGRTARHRYVHGIGVGTPCRDSSQLAVREDQQGWGGLDEGRGLACIAAATVICTEPMR